MFLMYTSQMADVCDDYDPGFTANWSWTLTKPGIL